METITAHTVLTFGRQIRNQLVQLGERKVTEEAHDNVMVEVARRAVLDYEETLDKGNGDGEDDSDIEVDQEDNGDSDSDNE